jgi:type VI secretion system protein ImpG
VDAKAAPYRSDLRQLAVETLCTNRDLPMQMGVGRSDTDFTLESNAPVVSVRCLAGPTPPRPSRAEGEMSWRIVSHLSLNYLSIVDSGNGQGAKALTDLLRLYGDANDPRIRKQIEGLVSIASRPIVRRVARAGPVAFARGLEVTLTFEEAAFEGTGVFLLGAVMDVFFSKYVSINSFTETAIRTKERGEIVRWPARMGLRHCL